MTQPTPRQVELAAKLREAIENSGTILRKLDNRPANIGMVPSLALAVQLDKLLSGEKP